MIWWLALLWISLAVLMLPALVIMAQVLLAWPQRPDSTPLPTRGVASIRVAILVPAHNESAVIAATLQALRPQLSQGDRLLVVADNCTDNTAALARAEGAEVVERHHLHHRGKGYALDFGVRHLCQSPPDVLLIVDADCKVEDGSVMALCERAAATQRPIQALYLMTAPKGSGLGLRLAEFAWRVKNLARPLGWSRLGWPCQLMGTGMAFPWAMAERMDLANGHLVEDMKLGIDLALLGTAPCFCPEARVTSEFPNGGPAEQSQRKRWEHGHLGMIFSQTPKLLYQALIRGDLSLLALGLDLLVPPLALLAGLLFLMPFVALASVDPAQVAMFLIASIATFVCLVASILLAWVRWGRDVVTLTELLSIPTYVAAKIPVYLSFVFKRQKEWVRTDRGDSADEPNRK